MTDVKVESPEKAPRSAEKKSISESEKPEKKVKSISESEKTEKRVKSQVKNNNAKNGPRNGKHDKLDDAAVEKEFLAFIAKMKSKYPGNGLAYQMNNYPEGLECTFRLARLPAGESSTFTASFSQPGHNKKKEMKELTEEQKVKLTAKKEKLRERRRETKLRKRVEKENENPEKPSENGDDKKPAVKDEKKVSAKEDKEEKVVPKEVKKVEKAVIKEDTKAEKVIA
eukprot:TRINITY_DN3623_c0_g1_i1.p1 TRINITY_DN3623_c0_g1~~TRINITY_DN3623_c0_g1_i1.p1  ORF type:complete len:238 (-),score=108.68 TRINITY_DN3623_c0_g1_i1:431-1108(-)